MIHTVGIAGLGLIGGSLAKCIRKSTSCRIQGFDIREDAMKSALANGDIDEVLGEVSQCDLVIVALFPHDTIEYIRQHCEELKPGAVVMDICGVKEFIVQEAIPLCRSRGAEFIGCHPMAGKEKWGYENSDATLFQNASMIMTPEGADEEKVQELEKFWTKIGFSRSVITTAVNHDRMIGYTSQLAHVLSNGYIKNPLAQEFFGYTGGSFQDLTRVAKLNPVMWSELFFCNRENLIQDLDKLITHLTEYRQALSENEPEKMTELLAEGSQIKEHLLEMRG